MWYLWSRERVGVVRGARRGAGGAARAFCVCGVGHAPRSRWDGEDPFGHTLRRRRTRAGARRVLRGARLAPRARARARSHRTCARDRAGGRRSLGDRPRDRVSARARRTSTARARRRGGDRARARALRGAVGEPRERAAARHVASRPRRGGGAGGLARAARRGGRGRALRRARPERASERSDRRRGRARDRGGDRSYAARDRARGVSVAGPVGRGARAAAPRAARDPRLGR